MKLDPKATVAWKAPTIVGQQPSHCLRNKSTERENAQEILASNNHDSTIQPQITINEEMSHGLLSIKA